MGAAEGERKCECLGERKVCCRRGSGKARRGDRIEKLEIEKLKRCDEDRKCIFCIFLISSMILIRTPRLLCQAEEWARADRQSEEDRATPL
jgi:hypothetical protein